MRRELEAARHLRTNDRIPGGVAASHDQQAAEKSLKGLLVSRGAEVPSNELDAFDGLAESCLSQLKAVIDAA